jgi:glutamate racemase
MDLPILVFDSGVGGLTILSEIEKHFQTKDILFCSDNAAFPYGTKTETDVRNRVSAVVTDLVARYTPSIVVIACNTASTVALESLRSQITTPIVGVVPAIKPAAALSRTKVIGLLATPGTIARAYTDKLIQEHAKDCKVIKLGSSLLVEMAEARLRGIEPDPLLLKKELTPLWKENLDTVVLGCTHFPLLKDLLQKTAPHPVQWLDSSAAIAKRVQEILGDQEGKFPGKKFALFTKNDQTAKALYPYLQKNGLVIL